ncbi:unnamed protein product [Rotaria sp. Silwood1]|nr:unnamed protein product [Rotaria sp. Silwood1]CAF4678227.1 unnamed protein product [Rotaria sp. Silwood1]
MWNNKISDSVELSNEILHRLDELYSLFEASISYDVKSVEAFRHKCIAMQLEDGFCSLTKIKSSGKRLNKQMDSDLESNSEIVLSNSKLNAQQPHEPSTSVPPPIQVFK